MIESSYGLYINFENSRGGWGDLLILAAEETTVLCKFPCLLILLPTDFEWSLS